MKKKTCIFLISFFITKVLFSQAIVDTTFIIIDSVYFQKNVFCEDIDTRTRCSDTTYYFVTGENIKNAYLDGIQRGKKQHRTSENIDSLKFYSFKNYFDSTYKCRKELKGYEFAPETTFYLKLMYLNKLCDSVPIMEGLFFQNQKYEIYNAGYFKEYDNKGRIKTEGNYIFDKMGARSISYGDKGVIQYGPIPRKYRKEKYSGIYIQAKKDGIWKEYNKGRLVRQVTYTKGEIKDMP